MIGTLKRSYVKRETGNTVFVYEVTGTQEELTAFEETQSKVIIDDNSGKHLFFATRAYCPLGKNVKLGISDSGNVYADLSEVQANASFLNQFEGKLGEAMAQVMAQQILGTPQAQAPAPTQPAPQPEAVEEKTDENADF